MLRTATSVLKVFGLEEMLTGVPTGTPMEDLVALGASRQVVGGLNFHQTSLQEALTAARADCKFVCVLLLSPQHEEMRAYITNLFSDEVCDILRREYILWVGNVHTPEGCDLSRRLRAATFPYLAVLYSHTSTKMICLKSLEGSHRPQVIDATLRHCQDTAGNLLVTQRADRMEATSRRRLQEEQDAALQAAEEEDRRRAEEERVVRERVQAEASRLERERVEAERALKLKEEELAAIRVREAERLGEEPSEGSDGGVGLAKLRVTMLDGSCVERRFLRSDKIAKVAALVYTHPSFTNDKGFAICTTFPAKVCVLCV